MKKILYVLMLMLLLVACEQNLENDSINLPETNISGNWTVNAFIDNDFIFGPFIVSTQNTSENELIYIKDNGTFWKFQTKAEIVNSNNSFESKLSENEISSIKANIKIINGKIINNDSIVFDIQFEDDETPYGYTYKIMGHRN